MTKRKDISWAFGRAKEVLSPGGINEPWSVGVHRYICFAIDKLMQEPGLGPKTIEAYELAKIVITSRLAGYATFPSYLHFVGFRSNNDIDLQKYRHELLDELIEEYSWFPEMEIKTLYVAPQEEVFIGELTRRTLFDQG